MRQPSGSPAFQAGCGVKRLWEGRTGWDEAGLRSYSILVSCHASPSPLLLGISWFRQPLRAAFRNSSVGQQTHPRPRLHRRGVAGGSRRAIAPRPTVPALREGFRPCLRPVLPLLRIPARRVLVQLLAAPDGEPEARWVDAVILSRCQDYRALAQGTRAEAGGSREAGV
jgi:hypothetical protein